MFFIDLKLIPIDYAAVLEKGWSNTTPVDRLIMLATYCFIALYCYLQLQSMPPTRNVRV